MLILLQITLFSNILNTTLFLSMILLESISGIIEYDTTWEHFWSFLSNLKINDVIAHLKKKQFRVF